VCSEQNVGIERRTSVCCVLFGVTIVYVASIIIHLAAASSGRHGDGRSRDVTSVVIIHLGPTIIGGYFDYNELIGNCIFVYGPVKSYVVHSVSSYEYVPGSSYTACGSPS